MVDETPRPAGRSESVEIEGYRYRLTLNGQIYQCGGWEGSEYYEREVTYRWWQGQGMLKRIGSRAQPMCFLFTAGRDQLRERNYFERHEPDGSLELGAFAIIRGSHSLRPHPQVNQAECLILDRIPDFIDRVCTNIEREYRKQLGKQVPAISLGDTTIEDLIREGLAYPDDGQLLLVA